MDSSSYSPKFLATTDPKTLLSDKSVACYGTVETMIARNAGMPNATVDQFYPGNTSLPKNVSVGPYASLGNGSQLSTGPNLMIIHGTTGYIDPKTGKSALDSNGKPALEDHYMLGTYVTVNNGKKIIIANDPDTGAQVQIDAQTHQVVNAPSKLSTFTAEDFKPVTITQ